MCVLALPTSAPGKGGQGGISQVRQSLRAGRCLSNTSEDTGYLQRRTQAPRRVGVGGKNGRTTTPQACAIFSEAAADPHPAQHRPPITTSRQRYLFPLAAIRMKCAPFSLFKRLSSRFSAWLNRTCISRFISIALLCFFVHFVIVIDMVVSNGYVFCTLIPTP